MNLTFCKSINVSQVKLAPYNRATAASEVWRISARRKDGPPVPRKICPTSSDLALLSSNLFCAKDGDELSLKRLKPIPRFGLYLIITTLHWSDTLSRPIQA